MTFQYAVNLFTQEFFVLKYKLTCYAVWSTPEENPLKYEYIKR